MRNSLIILILGLSFSLSAQFNVAVGYTLGYTPAEQINDLVFDFNESFRNGTYFGEEMPELHYLHGITLGLRWKYEKVSFELNWEKMNRTREAIGEDSQDVLYQETVFFDLNSYSAGLESNFGNLGLGLAVGLRNFAIKEEIASTGKKRPFLKEQQYFVKPFFSINLFGGSNVGISVKPYIQIPLSAIPLDALSQEFGQVPSGKSEPFWMGGVSIVFYNGTQ